MKRLLAVAVLAGCNGSGDCGPSDLEVDVSNPAGCAFGPLTPDSVALDVHLRDSDFTAADARFVSDDDTRFVFAIPSWANPNEIGYINYQRSSSGTEYAYGSASFAVDRTRCVTRPISATCAPLGGYDAGAFAPVTLRARCASTSELPNVRASEL